MRPRESVRAVAYPAVLGAVALMLVYLASLAPTGSWGIVALAGICPAGVRICVGLRGSLLCWGGVSLLALLLIPDKFCALLFALLFGLYPVVKSAIEGLRRRWAEYLLKLLFFNAAFTALFLLMGAAMLDTLPQVLSIGGWVLYLVANIVFLLYDYGLSKVIALYIVRIHSVIRR